MENLRVQCRTGNSIGCQICTGHRLKVHVVSITLIFGRPVGEMTEQSMTRVEFNIASVATSGPHTGRHRVSISVSISLVKKELLTANARVCAFVTGMGRKNWNRRVDFAHG